MKPTILLLALATAALSSCTTAYKSGQTPDDVYFSPAPPQDEYVQVERKDDRRTRNDQQYYDDRYLRMKVRDRMQWSDLDDYYYYDNRYSYSSYNNWNNPWSPSVYWNYYYNPYCNSCCVIVNGKNNIATGKPRVFNLNSYNATSLTYSNYNGGKLGSSVSPFSGVRTNNNNSNSSRNSGNFLRNIFNGNNNNSSNNNNNSSSTRSSGSSGSSSSSSSSSGSAPVRRF